MSPTFKSTRRLMLLAACCPLTVACAVDAGAMCESDVQNCDVDQTEQEVLYGADNRVEYSDPLVTAAQRKVADATGLVATKDADYGLSCSGASCSLTQDLISGDDADGNSVFGLCKGERFGPTKALPEGQHVALPGFGSGFLVAPDLFATAAHVVDSTNSSAYDACSQLAIVFGYVAPTGGDGPLTVAKSNVYSCKSVVLDDEDKDVALIRLDRPVTGRVPVPVRRRGKLPTSTPLVLAGHPDALPLKVASGARVTTNTAANFFEGSADAFHGNSGGPVANQFTGLVEGVVSSGNQDYVATFPAGVPDGCLKAQTCPETGCAGTFESFARATSLQALVPDQSPRAFTSGAVTIDAAYARVVGGDFDGDGRADVFFQGADGASDRIWYGKYDKTVDSVAITVPDGYGVPLVGDYNNDQRSDIFWYRSGTGQDRIWWGQATRSSFGAAANSTNMKQDAVGFAPFVADFDGNGGADIFWYGRGANAPAESIWWSNAQKSPTFAVQAQNIGGQGFYPVTGDFNADGKADILWFTPGLTSAPLWRHTTGKSFTSVAQAIPKAIGTSHRPYAADYDGNGAVDIFFYASGAPSDYVWWFRTDTRGAYRSTTHAIAGPYKPAIGDFNGDTAADVLWYGAGVATDSRSWGKLL